MSKINSDLSLIEKFERKKIDWAKLCRVLVESGFYSGGQSWICKFRIFLLLYLAVCWILAVAGGSVLTARSA